MAAKPKSKKVAPAKPKRARSDTTSSAVKAIQNASAGEIAPPDYVTLRETDMPFWKSIVSARARDLWNASDLENAANLARCKADIERLAQEIQKDGDVVTNAKGTQIPNPKHNLIETLTRRAMALSRMLHVHAEATVGNSRDSAKAASSEKAAKAVITNLADDSLIAPATTHH